MKKCYRCGKEKSLSDFYKHSGSKDGYLNKCKDCCKSDNSLNRKKKVLYYKKYEQERFKRGDRNESAKKYRKSEKGKLAHNKAVKKWSEKNKIKRQAHHKVASAIKRGELVKQPCIECGSDSSEAHHHDYTKPLEVEWLCPKHHKARH